MIGILAWFRRDKPMGLFHEFWLSAEKRADQAREDANTNRQYLQNAWQMQVRLGDKIRELRKEASLGRAATRYYLDVWRQTLNGTLSQEVNPVVDLEGNTLDEVKAYIEKVCKGAPQYVPPQVPREGE